MIASGNVEEGEDLRTKRCLSLRCYLATSSHRVIVVILALRHIRLQANEVLLDETLAAVDEPHEAANRCGRGGGGPRPPS